MQFWPFWRSRILLFDKIPHLKVLHISKDPKFRVAKKVKIAVFEWQKNFQISTLCYTNDLPKKALFQVKIVAKVGNTV